MVKTICIAISTLCVGHILLLLRHRAAYLNNVDEKGEYLGYILRLDGTLEKWEEPFGVLLSKKNTAIHENRSVCIVPNLDLGFQTESCRLYQRSSFDRTCF